MHNIKQYIENIHSFCLDIILIKRFRKIIPVIIDINNPINKFGPSKKNLEFISSKTSFSKNIAHEEQFLMADSQTSGGLLISVPLNKAKPLQNLLNENNCITNTIIGKIQNPSDFSIYVT